MSVLVKCMVYYILALLEVMIAQQLKEEIICEKKDAILSCNKTHFISIESVTFGPNSTCEPVPIDLKCANDVSAITRIKMRCNGNTRCDLSDTEDDYTSKCSRTPRHIQISHNSNGVKDKQQFCSTDVDFIRHWCSIGRSKNMTMTIGYEESCDNEFKMEDLSTYIDETCHGLADCGISTDHNEILFQPKFLRIQYTCKDNAMYTRAVCENDSLKISCDQDSIAIQDTERLPSKTECSDDSNCYENFNKNFTSRSRSLCDKFEECTISDESSMRLDDCFNKRPRLLSTACSCGRTSMLIVCEGNGPSLITCNTSIHIISAVYGRTDRATCRHQSIQTVQCLDNNSLPIIRDLCENNKSCHVNANNGLYGDPCPRTYKYLNVTFQCTAPITRQICTNNLQDDICDLDSSSYIFPAEKIEICPENDDYCRYPNDLSTHGCYKRTYTVINYMCEVTVNQTVPVTVNQTVPDEEQSTDESGNSPIIGIASGVVVVVLVIVVSIGVLIIRKKRLSLKTKRPTGSQNVYEDTGHQASPVRMTGSEHSDLHTRYDSHKYQDLQSVSQSENVISYDYIDINEHERKLRENSDVLASHEYLELYTGSGQFASLTRKSDKINKTGSKIKDDTNNVSHDITETGSDRLKITSNHGINDASYVILDPNDTGFDRSKNPIDAHSNSYTVLDPSVTGYCRTKNSTIEVNDYELAKPIDGETNDDIYLDGNYVSPSNNYDKMNAARITGSNENVYNHVSDTVYDTTNGDHRINATDITYDHLLGTENNK